MFIYSSCKYNSEKAIARPILQYRANKIIFFYFVKYSTHRKLFQMQVVDPYDSYIFIISNILNDEPFFEKSVKFYFISMQIRSYV
jgi:hypothetical protein